MAAAGPSALASCEEKTNGSKLSRLLIDGGTTVLRNVFNHHHPPANLAAKLNANYSALNNLLRRRVLNGHQWDKLFPPGGAMPDSNTFDITLLFLLLTNICGLSPPPTGWHAKPPPSDNSYEANLARVKYFRNVLYGNVTSTGVDTHSFAVLWLEISSVLVALGLHQSEIDRLKAEQGGEEDYLDALRDWTDCEIEIKTQLKDVSQAQKEMKQTFLETQETFQESKAKLEDVHQVVTEIRQAQLNTDQEEDILKQLAKVDTENIIKYHSERYLEGTRVSIFVKVKNWLNDNNSFHRVMVIVGNAGMGKSVIAAEISKRMQQDRRLLGSHFCQHNKMRHRNPRVMLQSLVCHLSYSLPEYKEALVEQLSRNLGLDINDMETEELFELLFEEPLNRLSDPDFTSLVVIDALDESEYQGRNELLEVIAKYFNKLPIWIRFLVTTRPEINIWDSLKGLRPLLLEPNDEENIKDIRHLFERNLRPMFQVNNHESILTELVQKSEGVILWAQFLVDFIKENFSVLKREHLGGTIPSGISSVYQSYFKRLETELCKELNMSEDMFLSLLSVIAASREPLPLGFVSNFLFPGKVSSAVQRKVSKAIACISSLLPVQEGCIHFFHKSVKDWLVDQSYYGKHSFSVLENEGHLILARLCGNKFDEVKRKGVDRSQQFDEVTKYALRHGVQHMLQLGEEIRPRGLEEIVNNYVLDVELIYAKLRVDGAIPCEDIACISNFSMKRQAASKTLLFLLRKHISSLKQLPHVIFQTLLNEGGPDLCSEASNLLNSKYSHISHMEYLDKNNLERTVQTTFHCSSEVACFDVSPSSDYMVCECRDGTIQLWSLQTGKLIWKRPVIKMKLYCRQFQAFRTAALASFSPHFVSLPLSELSTFALSCFRSVVFHPTRKIVLPGVLSETYSFDGDLNRLFPGSNCIFSVCSISGDTILTDCPDNAKCLILWSLSNSKELTRTTRHHNVLTFARSQDGRVAAISHSDGSICLVDLMSNFRPVARTVLQSICGMIKISPDHRFLYCWHCPLRYGYQHPDLFKITVNKSNCGKVFLDVASKNVSYVPWEWESSSRSGFMLGDPLCCRSQTLPPSMSQIVPPSLGTFVFVLNKQSILRSNPRSESIEMLSPYKLKKCSGAEFFNSLQLSLTGDTVYSKDTVHSKDKGYNDKGVLFRAWDASSGALKAEKLIYRDKCGSSSENDQHKEGRAKPRSQFTKAMLRVSQAMTRTRVRSYEQDESREPSPEKVVEQEKFHDHNKRVRAFRAEKISEQYSDRSSSNYDPDESEELKAETFIYEELALDSCLEILPVKKGVLLLKFPYTLELWNFQLSKCIERWSFSEKFNRIIPVSGDLVCLISPSLQVLKMFDTSSGQGQSSIYHPGKFITCNGKGQVMFTFDLRRQTITLFQGQTVLWYKYWPRLEYLSYMAERFSFSPDDQFFVISGMEQGLGVYLLDAYSGSTLQKLWRGEAARSVFVSNEECVIQTSEPPSVTCLRLFNVRSGQQLSVLNIESQLAHLAVSPWNGLIAICEKNANHNFRVIRLKLSGDNEESRRIKGQFSL